MYINVKYFGTLSASDARPPKISSLNCMVKQVHKLITNTFVRLKVRWWLEAGVSGVELRVANSCANTISMIYE